MGQVAEVISVLLRGGIVGGLYGVLLGVCYAEFLVADYWFEGRADLAQHHDLGSLALLIAYLILSVVLGIIYGSIVGLLCGFVSGMLGVGLGGPIGCSIGGLVGRGAAMLLFCGGPGAVVTAMITTAAGAILGLVGAITGVVVGSDLRRLRPRLICGEWLAKSIYSSPLAGWLGWRRPCY